MDYTYLEEATTADVAFRATGKTLEELFTAASEATINVMIEDPDSIEATEKRVLHVEAASCELLLFDLLQELIYFKDAEQLLLRLKEVRIAKKEGGFILDAKGFGERLDPVKHELNSDVKAVTLYRFSVSQTASGWEAYVILDI